MRHEAIMFSLQADTTFVRGSLGVIASGHLYAGLSHTLIALFSNLILAARLHRALFRASGHGEDGKRFLIFFGRLKYGDAHTVLALSVPQFKVLLPDVKDPLVDLGPG